MVGGRLFLVTSGLSFQQGGRAELFDSSGKGRLSNKCMKLRENEIILFFLIPLIQIVPFLLYFSHLILRDSKDLKDVVERL